MSGWAGAEAVGNGWVQQVPEIDELGEDPSSSGPQLIGLAVELAQPVEKVFPSQVKTQALSATHTCRLSHVHALLGGPSRPELVHGLSDCPFTWCVRARAAILRTAPLPIGMCVLQVSRPA